MMATYNIKLLARDARKALKILNEQGLKEFVTRIKDRIIRSEQTELSSKPRKILDYDTSPVHFIGSKFNQEGLERALENLREKPFVLAISQDNYLKVVGGVQLKIADQQREMNDKGLSYLHLSPFKARTTLDFSNKPGVMNLDLDGQFIGFADDETLLSAFTSLSEAGTLKEIAIHHLIGWKLSYVEQLLILTKNVPVHFWLHDFFSICPNYKLLRNDREYCHAPEPRSNACQLCIYGSIRPLHYQAFRSLFQRFPIQVISPSEFALDLWCEKFPMNPSEVRVVPHAKLEWGENLKGFNQQEPLKVAFVGYPVLHKGWQTWLNLTNQFGKDSRYKFYLFSANKQPSHNFDNISVEVTRQNRSAMIDALRKNEIDVAFLWSICPETFSFTLYEALAAGCFVITNPASGNIQAYIKANPAAGLVVDDEHALMELFEGNTLVDYIAEHQADGKKGANLIINPII